MNIVIVDYKMGNPASIINMLKKIGYGSVLSSDHSSILDADKLILPGVGSFDQAVRNINELNLRDVLNEKVIVQKTPILGICLGMQLITKTSEEGALKGFGWIDSYCKKFYFSDKISHKVPHMGWNTIQLLQEHSLFNELSNDPRFYFVHSYYVVCSDTTNVLTLTNHGFDFASSIVSGNVLGVQFHPEKSHKFGLKIMKNFVEM